MVNFLIWVYLVMVVLTSLIAFVLYGWDKRQAKRDGWRVPEDKLHLMAWLGGWPGALAGQQVFRHKTQKKSFKFMTGLACLMHIALFVSMIAMR